MLRLAAAGPCGTVFAHQIFALSGKLVFIRKPRHKEDNEFAILLEDPCKLRRDLLMIEIPEALACGDHIKRLIREIDLLGRNNLIIDVHAGFFRQSFRLLDLLGRDVGAGPFRAELIHVARQNARAGTKVQNLLAINAKPPVSYLLIEDVGIDVSVFCIELRSLAPVKGLAFVDPVICNVHFYIPPGQKLFIHYIAECIVSYVGQDNRVS